MSATKKCSLCAEEIPLAAVTCQYCGAQFTVTRSGYCETCHQVREADEAGQCKVCGHSLVDFQIESKAADEPARREEPASVQPVNQTARSSSELIVLPVKGEGVNYRYASLILDGAFIGLIFMACLALVQIASTGLKDLTQLELNQLGAFFTPSYGNEKVLILIPVIWFLYYFILETAFSTTPGKASLSLQVIQKGGGRIRWWQAAVRVLFAPIDLLIGVFFILFTPLKQRLGDLFAGTLVVNREKIHKAEFNPPAISLEFHNYRRVELTQMTSGIVYKFGMIRELVLRGLTADEKPVKLKLSGHLFRPEFEMLRLNIENRYGLKFPEKIILWRLLVVILVPLLGLLSTVVMVLYLMNSSSRPTSSANQPKVFATQTPRPSATLRPTTTRIPAATATPRPIEATFDSLSSYVNGRLVILVGRLALMSSTRCSSQSCALLLENPAKPSQKLTIFVSVGSGRNQMKPLHDNYTKSDIQVVLNDGNLAVVGYRIQVTGKVCKTTTNEVCISNISKIELFQVK